jgi:RNA polymerase sigma-70 factor (ECF subfamily)
MEHVVNNKNRPTPRSTFTQVLRDARNHDEEALAALYRHAFSTIHHYVLARLASHDQTEEVVSEVFLKMIEAIGNLRTEQEAGFYAWLFQITRCEISKALKHSIQRRHKHLPLQDMLLEEDCQAAELVDPHPASDPVSLYEWGETLEEVQLALNDLSAEQQMVITGHFLAGQRIKDLAQVLGKQPGAVRILQFRALEMLAQRLGLAHRPRLKKGRS